MIVRRYPRHKVEYPDLAEAVDLELDSLIQDAEEDGHVSREEVENAKKVLETYKNRLDKVADDGA